MLRMDTLFAQATNDELDPVSVREELSASREELEGRMAELLGAEDAEALQVELPGPWSQALPER